MRKLITIIFGIVFICVGVYLIKSNKELVARCTAGATGTVIDIIREESSDDDGISYTYYPVIEYDVNGEKVSSKSSLGYGSSSKYKVNDKIDILYNPADTQEFIIKGDNTNNIISYVCLGIGILVVIFGIFKFLVR